MKGVGHREALDTLNITLMAGRPYVDYTQYKYSTLTRCLAMIDLLKRQHMTREELADRFDIHKRTVYRYLNLFEGIGYSVDKDMNERFFIFGEPKF